ncbi:acyl-CoA-binding domain-containing protein 3-like isoform X1 [Carya illinoinensis]|uniref:ACB domain-containing protein n=1 Tax=Carya illinoinensis TaxID=32201 RepID=A0A8T1RHK2_CARIL|nr:acyl-CoA-binding domain-containing protein 3-like isoform X1 [Carya illinoinensis]KAG6666105.1 hypothetical protein CIPAW_01G007300 [Carya illinoinensis]
MHGRIYFALQYPLPFLIYSSSKSVSDLQSFFFISQSFPMELLFELLLTVFLSLTLCFLLSKLLYAASAGDKNRTSTLTSRRYANGIWVMPEELKLQIGRRFRLIEKTDKNVTEPVQDKLDVQEFVNEGFESTERDIRGEKHIEEVSERCCVGECGESLVDGSSKGEKLCEIELESVKSEVDSARDVLVCGGKEGCEFEKSGDDEFKDKVFGLEDDWEGIERTELEKVFGAAVVLAGSASTAGRASSLGSDVEAQLYGLHKIATQGPCHEPQPMALKLSARAKWNAWQRLGNMSPEVAMEQYIALLSRSFPRWMQYDFVRGNKQVLEEFEAFRRLASDLEELPSIRLGAADERKMEMKPHFEAFYVTGFGVQNP